MAQDAPWISTPRTGQNEDLPTGMVQREAKRSGGSQKRRNHRGEASEGGLCPAQARGSGNEFSADHL